MQFGKLLEVLMKDAGAAFQIPAGLYSFAVPSFLGVRAGQALNDLTVSVDEFYGFEIPEKQEIIVALNRIGSCLDEAGVSYKTRAGWFYANPAVICIPDLPGF